MLEWLAAKGVQSRNDLQRNWDRRYNLSVCITISYLIHFALLILIGGAIHVELGEDAREKKISAVLVRSQTVSSSVKQLTERRFPDEAYVASPLPSPRKRSVSGAPGQATSAVGVNDPLFDFTEGEAVEGFDSGIPEGAEFWDVPPPVFSPPMLSWEEKIAVLLRVHILPSGSVERVEINKSSGFPSLDDTAVEATQARQFAWSTEPRSIDLVVTFFNQSDS